MPSITPDFTDAGESTGTGTIPMGDYKARVVDAELKTSQAGNPYVNWKLQIFGMEGDAARYNNWPVFHRTMLTGKGAMMLRSFLAICIPGYDGGAFETEDCLGKEMLITIVEKRDQNGQVSSWPDVKRVVAL